MVVGVVIVVAVSYHQQYFIDVVAVDKFSLQIVGAIVFSQDLPVVVIVIKGRFAGQFSILFSSGIYGLLLPGVGEAAFQLATSLP